MQWHDNRHEWYLRRTLQDWKQDMAGRGGRPSTLFKPGQSGNPSGRPKKAESVERAKIIADVKALAKARSEDAIKTLVNVMENHKAPPAARVSAAMAILDRGWGRPSQPVQAEISIFERLTNEERDALIAALESAIADEEGFAGGVSGTAH
jgi:hypothetical protein